MRFDVTLPGRALRFSIEASDDREAVNVALLIAREQHHDVVVHDAGDGRLVADTTDDRAVSVAPRGGPPPAGARDAPELAPKGPTSSPHEPEKG